MRNQPAHVSYLFDHPAYKLSNAFDRRTTTLIYSGSTYLDDGYEWLMVELSKTTFQVVESVTLSRRTGASNGFINACRHNLLITFIFQIQMTTVWVSDWITLKLSFPINCHDNPQVIQSMLQPVACRGRISCRAERLKVLALSPTGR